MAFNEKLAVKVRGLLEKNKNLEEKKMFGGIGFMLNGNMCCGVHGDELIVRVNPDAHEEFAVKRHIREFDLSRGSSMRGWLLLKATGCVSDKTLKEWVGVCVQFAGSLPEKKKPKKRKK